MSGIGKRRVVSTYERAVGCAYMVEAAESGAMADSMIADEEPGFLRDSFSLDGDGDGDGTARRPLDFSGDGTRGKKRRRP